MRAEGFRAKHRLSRSVQLVPLLSLVLVFAASHPARALTPADDVLYRSDGLRIYRSLSRQGTPVVVLTNLDADGNLLSGGEPTGIVPVPAPRAGTGGAAADQPSGDTVSHAPATDATAAGSGVRVVVNGDGGGAVDPQNVAVSTDGSGATTVIININPPAPVAAVPPPIAYPIVTYAGVPGGFHYPDHLYFLGYGPGVKSPSWFGGLGLNAGNGFGLKTGAPCGHGYDCMFAPSAERP